MVFGLALALSVPFIVKAQGSMVDIRTSSQILEARDSLNKIDSAAETVNAAGEPARRTFAVEIPDSTSNTTVADNYVRISINTSSGYVGLDRQFDFNVTGELPKEDGLYILSASAVNGSVDFKVVE
jgi:hypothetical protein